MFCISTGAGAQQQKAAAAPQQDYKSYLVIKGGIFYPRGDLDDLKVGFNGEFAYGYRFHPNGAVEFSTGYFQTSDTYREIYNGVGASAKAEVSAIPLTVAIKGIIPIDKQWDVYGLAGGGAYFVHGKLRATAAGFGSASLSDNTTVAGGFLGAGTSYNITKEIFLGLEAKYLWTGTAKLSKVVNGTNIDADFKIEGLFGTLNLGYRF